MVTEGISEENQSKIIGYEIIYWYGKKPMHLNGNLYKLIAVPCTIFVFVIAVAICRARRAKGLTYDETTRIFKRSYVSVIIAIVIIFIVLFYLNNRPW